ncbi:MAG: enoyl-ACP reductase [Chloroflexi bacterium]|nr:enoyl-ACP reductase [Chloroflexota bacterium]
MVLLEGKLGLIFGVANRRSIAWGIAQSLGGAGARLAFTYQDRVGETVQELAATIPGSITMPCDVQDDAQTAAVFEQVDREFGGLDFLIHSIAFAGRDALENPFYATSREAFQMALDISAYSLIALTRASLPLMEKRGGGSVITMTFLGSDRVFPKYNVMGVAKASLEACVRYLAYELGPKNIRVNAISAGPIRTLAARGIPGYNRMEEYSRTIAPMRRNTDPSEVGDTALFLCSELGRGITGEIVHVDNGAKIVGSPTVEQIESLKVGK